MKRKSVVGLIAFAAFATSAQAATPTKPLSTYGFDKNLTINSLSSLPTLYFSPQVGSFLVTGAADIGPSAGVDGNSKKHGFFLDTTVTISGIFPVAPAVASASGSIGIQSSGTALFSIAWDGLSGGTVLPDGLYRYDLDATLQRVGPGASSKILDIDAAVGAEFIYDATAPLLSLSISDGAFLDAARPSLAVTFADALAGVDAASLHLTLNGQDVSSQFTVNASGAIWNPTADLAEGAYVFTATIADRAGNVGTETTGFTVDLTPPSLSLVPAEGAQLLVQRPDLSGAYSDALSGINVSSVQAAIDGAVATARFNVTASDAVWKKDADQSFGSHTLTISVADRAGNSSVLTVAYSIIAPYRYFTFEGEEIRFMVESRYFLVKLSDGVSPLSVLADLLAAGASEIATQADPFGFYEVGVAAGNSVSAVQDSAKQITGVAKVYPVVAWPDGRATGTAEGVYVKFTNGTSDVAARATLTQAGAVSIDADCCEAFAYFVRASLSDASEDFLLADSLRGAAGVTYAAPSLVIRYAESIGGPLPSATTATQGYLAQAGVQESWNTVYGHSSYFVDWTAEPIGLLGAGVQASHPGLSGRVLPGYSAFGGTADPDASAHVENSLGTAMAGVIATNWGYNGLNGITKDSPILPARIRQYSCGQISGACFWTTSDQAIKAGAKAALDSGAHVLLFDSRFAEYLPQSIAYMNAALPAAFNGRGAVAVFPMGDEKHELYSYRAPTPLNIANTAFVTAVDENNTILERANVHATDSTRVNFAAPGSPILTLDATGTNGAGSGDTAVWQGTPMAAAIYAGGVALSYLIDPSLTADDILSLSQQTGTVSEENIERSPLFKFFLYILSILHMQERVEKDMCDSPSAQPDFGLIHQVALGGELASRPLPTSVQLLQGGVTSAFVGFSVYKKSSEFTTNLCATFDWSGNINPLLLSADKRVIRFSNTTADKIKLRAKKDDAIFLESVDAAALGIDPLTTALDYSAVRVLDKATVLHNAQVYAPFGVRQPYSRTATMRMWTNAGASLNGANTQIRACVRRCFFFVCSTVCSPGVSLLDTSEGLLGDAQKALKAAILSNESLTYEYRQLEAEFDMNDPGFDNRILTPDAATRLEAFRSELSAAVGADLLLSAVGLLDNASDLVGNRYGDLIR